MESNMTSKLSFVNVMDSSVLEDQGCLECDPRWCARDMNKKNTKRNVKSS